jgi:hypothetical protein
LTDLIAWLGATPLSTTLVNHVWTIPLIQSIHIVAIAVLTASVVLIDLRLLRGAGTGPVVPLVRRFAPWTYGALAVLLLTGSLLVVAEPSRELTNPLFWVKMGLVAAATVMTLIFQRIVWDRARHWDAGEHRVAAVLFASASLILWTAIIISGRWIAYIQVQ